MLYRCARWCSRRREGCAAPGRVLADVRQPQARRRRLSPPRSQPPCPAPCRRALHSAHSVHADMKGIAMQRLNRSWRQSAVQGGRWRVCACACAGTPAAAPPASRRRTHMRASEALAGRIRGVTVAGAGHVATGRHSRLGHAAAMAACAHGAAREGRRWAGAVVGGAAAEGYEHAHKPITGRCAGHLAPGSSRVGCSKALQPAVEPFCSGVSASRGLSPLRRRAQIS